MEKLVENKLDELWNTLDNCKCERCRNDIIALTLNQLGAKYVVTHEGELYARLCTLSNDYDVEILKAIAKSVHTVKEKPNHYINNVI
jgi:competence protein ComFB